MKARILERVLNLLLDVGYEVLNCMGIRSCFDIIAKKEHIFLIKILTNVEAINNKSATELKNISKIISAVPLIVGERTKNTKLISGVIYARYGISVINTKTLEEILKEQFPLIYSVRGNYCVRIKSELLSKLRKRMGFTQEELASRLGISKQSVHRYESSGRISLKIAERLIDLLENDITISRNIFRSESQTSEINDLEYEYMEYITLTSLKKMVIDELNSIGFLAFPTNAPFDIIAKEQVHKKRILSVVSNDVKTIERKMEINRRITEITGDYSVCISEKKHRLLNIPVIRPVDLSVIKNPREFMELLSEQT